MTTTTNSDEGQYSNEALAANRWYHIVAVREGGTQAIYINGLLDGSRTCSTNPIDFVGGYDNDQVNIGRYTTTLGQPRYHLKGLIDEVMIFNRAISEQEIAQLYEGIVPDGNTWDPANPLFANTAKGDYHLRSSRGRYWPEHKVWVLDEVTSPCIDGGDPEDDYSQERQPNGERINIGAYGGTPYASMSQEQPFSADVNGDGLVDISDIVELIEKWLVAAGWTE